MTGKRWVLPAPVDYQLVRSLEAEFPLHRLLIEILVRRGVSDPVAVDRFIHPRLEHLHDPFLLPGMEAAVSRVVRAVSGGEQISVFGDYDVDGVTSTALLLRFFRAIGAKTDFFIPHRSHDGYGLSMDALKEARNRGTSVVITVDNGIADVEEVAWAQANGIDMIVTDHHQVPESAPVAHAVVNPHLEGSQFPFPLLCGCGVAFNLAMAVRRRLRDQGYFTAGREPPNLKDLIPYAALGTVADVVPLTDENRIFVKYGLQMMEKTADPGLKALIQVSGADGRELSARDIGFGLAPRLNAAGRMSFARDGVELLTTTDEEKARELARILNDQNSERRSVEAQILTEAVELVEANGLLRDRKAIVVWKEGWHPGVIGIVAARLVDKYYRPTVVLAVEDGKAKGSCRTIPTYNIYEGLRFAHQPGSGATHGEGLFESFGGHKFAAGLTLETGRLSLFYDRLDQNVRKWTSEESFTPELRADAVINVNDVTPELVHELARLKPFGVMNEPPVFIVQGGQIRWPKVLKEAHLKFRLSDPTGRSVDVIGFRMGEGIDAADMNGRAAEVAGYLELNHYPPDNPSPSVQIRMLDYRLS
ncbi:MAG: single-stranded-DNA-specific exonuclease RecJ [Deltaproteobacteria bacterium]|nr:single-stranded-DNA-specific exonuclease RecJ [Deltaproteobacteria bacterium]